MFNPLVDNLSDLSDAEIDEKINLLSRRYWMTKNPDVQNQITTLLDMYRFESEARRASAMLKAKDNDSDNPLDNLINVS